MDRIESLVISDVNEAVSLLVSILLRAAGTMVVSINRKSKDDIVNNFGRSLLSMCRELDVHTLNGRNGKDLNGEFTYLS